METDLRAASTIGGRTICRVLGCDRRGRCWRGGIGASSHRLRSGTWPVGHIALERQRRFGIDIQDRHRDISGDRRRDVVCRRRLSRRAIADQMGGRPHHTKFSFAIPRTALSPGPSHAFERERLEFGDGISRQWRRGGSGRCGIAGHPLRQSGRYLRRQAIPPDTAGQPASAPGSSSDAGNPNPAAPSGANSNQSRAEVLRLWTASFHDNQDLSAADKAYVAQVVAARTGMSQADAEKRVNDVITEAKTAADNARKGAAKLSFWLTAAMLFGAFAASLAAVEGGSLRDGTWNDRVLTPRPI